MVYRFHDRLRHVGSRNKQNIKVNVVFRGVRDGVTYTFPTEATAILVSSDEFAPGNSSITRVEYQDFVLDRVNLRNLYPPKDGDQVILETNETYDLVPVGDNEPCYQHTTFDRERVIVHTRRRLRGFVQG